MTKKTYIKLVSCDELVGIRGDFSAEIYNAMTAGSFKDTLLNLISDDGKVTVLLSTEEIIYVAVIDEEDEEDNEEAEN